MATKVTDDRLNVLANGGQCHNRADLLAQELIEWRRGDSALLEIVREVLHVAEASPDAATLAACIADGIPVYRVVIAAAEAPEGKSGREGRKQRNPSVEPYYLPMDCPLCGRHRMEWDGKVLSCEKCGASSENDSFDADRYCGASPPASPEASRAKKS